MFTIFVAPTVITASEPTYLTFHLLDTIAMNVELAFAITTTKDIGKEFDVTYISYMGLLIIHLLKKLRFNKGKQIIQCTLRGTTAFTKDDQVISIPNEQMPAFFQFLA